MICQIQTELGEAHSATPSPSLEEESFAWEVITKSTRKDFLEVELEILHAMLAVIDSHQTPLANRPQIV